MINRGNYILAKEFLAYLRDVPQLNPSSTGRYWSYLKHQLLWADETPFSKAADLRPTFASYLTSSRDDGRAVVFAPLTLKKIFQTSKRLFAWSKVTYQREFRAMPMNWIDAIRLPRTAQTAKEHEFVALEEVQRLARLPVPESDLAMRRDQAAAAMLFLSAMRAGALGSLTLGCVDLASHTVKQWPSLGVKTKNSKTATTYLLDIPDLIAVVENWDSFIRTRLPSSASWYTPIISQWGEQTLYPDPPGANRNIALARRLHKLFSVAGLPYRSPHKFRHGHAVFALQHAKTMADYKAVSTNLMHDNIAITDGIYAPLAKAEVKDRVAGLTARPTPPIVGADPGFADDLTDGQLAAVLSAAAHRLSG